MQVRYVDGVAGDIKRETETSTGNYLQDLGMLRCGARWLAEKEGPVLCHKTTGRCATLICRRHQHGEFDILQPMINIYKEGTESCVHKLLCICHLKKQVVIIETQFFVRARAGGIGLHSSHEVIACIFLLVIKHVFILDWAFCTVVNRRRGR